jgi:DNA-directed RNA polymerase specialized sigma24 family protein
MINMMASFSELDQMIKDGQGKSHRFVEVLVSQYYDYIHRLAVSILGDSADADDICQETFIDALLYIDRYSPDNLSWFKKMHKCQHNVNGKSDSSSQIEPTGNLQVSQSHR